MVHGNMLSFVRKKSVSQMLKFLCFHQCLPSSLHLLSIFLFLFSSAVFFTLIKFQNIWKKINSFQRIILDFYYKHSRQEAKGSKTQKTIKESRAESPISFASDNFIFRLIFLISQFCLFEDVANILQNFQTISNIVLKQQRQKHLFKFT